jgi:predicted ester cyclase
MLGSKENRMSVDTSTKTINSYLETLFSGGDFSQYFSADVVWTTMETGDQVHGREEVRDYIVALHTQLFDARPEVRSLTVGSETAALEADFVGTHIGEFAGIPPTGADLRVPYCVIYDLAEDSIRALRAYIPIGSMVSQLQAAATASVS